MIGWRRSKEDSDDRGAALIEFALVFTLLLSIALGAFEYGMLFRDWLSVTVATREGGRVAASAANYLDADCIVLEAVTGALQSLTSGEVTQVHIYKSDGDGNYPGTNSTVTNRYRPATSSDTTSLVVCGSSTWVELHNGGSWEPDDRVNTSGSADWSGVRVEFDHDWGTNFLWWTGTASFSDDAIFRMEPAGP